MASLDVSDVAGCPRWNVLVEIGMQIVERANGRHFHDTAFRGSGLARSNWGNPGRTSDHQNTKAHDLVRWQLPSQRQGRGGEGEHR